MISRNGSKTKIVRDALLEYPLAIPVILKDKSFDPKITHGILYNLLPRRTSIEIESFGILTDDYIDTDPNTSFIKSADCYHYINLANKYNVLSLTMDDFNRGHYNEHKISIKNYTQVVGLYQILELMKDKCELNPFSGCHIHVDITDICDKIEKVYNIPINRWVNDDNQKQEETKQFFKQFLNPIDDLFGYTDHKEGACPRYLSFQKGGMISFRSDFRSLEFRTAPQTFEYTTIIKWFIGLNKIVNQYHKWANENYVPDKVNKKTLEVEPALTSQCNCRFCTSRRTLY